MDNNIEKKTRRSAEQKKRLMNRLKRLEGQIRGIEKMLDNDAYCNDILQQSMAAGSAIDGFNQELLEYHLKGCVTDGIKNDDEEIVDELLKTLRKLMK
ncbi:MAG: metal-sensing transcriptional repressor [Lachnospiraceae bacterium]|nr:metal-sensing transcriptional repressor [Lachnospiraceae bacterium]